MTTTRQTTRPPIAVVGVSALFPGSVDATGFWNDILAGADRITDVPATHWLIDDYYDADPTAPDKTYGRRGGFLEPVDFDPLGFGIPPSVMPATDTAQLLALIVAQQVLDDAMRGQFAELDRSAGIGHPRRHAGQELVGAMASRLSRPMWLQGMRRAGVAEDVAAGCVRPDRRPTSWVAGEHLSRAARQRRRRADRQPPRPRRHQLRHRRGVRILVLGDLDGDQRAAPRRQRPRDRRRRRHVQRHLHVHVLQQDAGPVADRRTSGRSPTRPTAPSSARASAWSC